MTFGLTFEKLVLIGLIAVMLVGPTRLPVYAASLARLVKRAREFAKGASERVRDELGPEVSDVDWRQLDPRRYDPRRIIREALLEDATPAHVPPPPPELTTAPPALELTPAPRPVTPPLAPRGGGES